MTPQKIRPFLWFDRAAEQAAEFYCSLLPNSQVSKITRHPEGGMAPAGTVMTVEFTLSGVEFVALNGGPMYKLTEAFSISVECKDQAEIDCLWDKLIADGGAPSMCGWLKDRWGLSWQIIPAGLPQLLADPSGRVMQAMMQMTKLSIHPLEAAFEDK